MSPTTTVSFCRGSGRELHLAAGSRHGANLLHQTRDVYDVPVLHHLAVAETEDVGSVEVGVEVRARALDTDLGTSEDARQAFR